MSSYWCLVAAGGVSRALQGVKSVIALGRLGALLPAAERAGVERIVLLSTAGKAAWVTHHAFLLHH